MVISFCFALNFSYVLYRISSIMLTTKDQTHPVRYFEFPFWGCAAIVQGDSSHTQFILVHTIYIHNRLLFFL